MSKVYWPEPKIASAYRRPGQYGSFQEFMTKQNKLLEEQEAAQTFLQKAFPIMLNLLEYRLRNNEPLVVMRPLRYQTSELQKGEREGQAKFVDSIKTIMPGTSLVLKSLDPTMREFVFEDGAGNEYEINFADRNALMTQTNLFEDVKLYLESKSE